MPSLQRVLNIDCVLGLSLKRDQGMYTLGLLLRRGYWHWLVSKVNRSNSGLVFRRQWRLVDALAVLSPGPVATWGHGDVVSDADLSQANVGQAELFAQAVDRFGPHALVQLLARQRDRNMR